MNRTSKTLREIAADYIHLAQDADGNVDPTRKIRFEWLMRLADLNLPAVAMRQAWAK